MIRLQLTIVTPQVNHFRGWKYSMGLLANSHESLAHLAILLNKVQPPGNWAIYLHLSCGPGELIHHLVTSCCLWPLSLDPWLDFADSPGCWLPWREPPSRITSSFSGAPLSSLSPSPSSSEEPTLMRWADWASLCQGARNSKQMIKTSFTQNTSGPTDPQLERFRVGDQTVSFPSTQRQG